MEGSNLGIWCVSISSKNDGREKLCERVLIRDHF